jgi:hypothetical protein
VVVTRPDGNEGFELLREITTDERLRELPVLAYLPERLGKTERARLEALSKSAMITVVDSPERLAERAVLFMHRPDATVPGATRKALGRLRTGDAPLQGKKVLVIDDDIRNVFALTSALEQRAMKVVSPRTGARRSSGSPAPEHRPRAARHHDAGDGRVRDGAGDSCDETLRAAPDHLADHKGDEGRPREGDRRRRVGLNHQAS